MAKMTKKQQKEEKIKTILDAATEIFAEVGFAGARIDAIAERAGINKAAIYYNVGEKEVLYSKVLSEVFGKGTDIIIKEIQKADNAEEKLKTYIRQFAIMFNRNPNMPPIFLRELAGGAQKITGKLPEIMMKIISTLEGILSLGEKENLFKKVFPLNIHFMIVGCFLLLRVSIPIRKKFDFYNDDLKGDSFDIPEIRINEVTELVLSSIKK